MIEISHQQARRLIEASLDGRDLPDAQWAVLQAHLEGCPACRAYQKQLSVLETGLERALHARWTGYDAPLLARGALASALKQAREARARRWKRLRWALLGVLLALVWLGYVEYLRGEALASAPRLTPTLPAATLPAVLASQAAQPVFRGDFSGVLAFSGRLPGGTSSDIYLLNAGGSGIQLTNLTNTAYDDSFPAWSPDGLWLAFISIDPDTRKEEVFTISVAGTRLTQVTNRPDVAWSGPISWSADGQWLALRGYRAGQDESFVYLVPLSGSAQAEGSRTLALTRGGNGPVLFSPTAPLLAFANPSDGSFQVFDQVSAWFDDLRSPEDIRRAMQVQGENPFAWSPDGRLLAYITTGPYNPRQTGQFGPNQFDWATNLLLSQPLYAGGLVSSSVVRRPLLSISGLDALADVSWSPDLSRRVLAYLSDEHQDGCWTVHLQQVTEATLPARANIREVPGLCVAGNLSNASWTPDGEWLVVNGSLPGQRDPGYYALRVPLDLALRAAAPFELVLPAGDLPLAATPGADAAVVRYTSPPQVRPSLNARASALQIDPQPAGLAPPIPPTSAPNPEVPGQLVFTTTAPNSVLSAIRPDGRQQQVLRDYRWRATCPALSPDGQQLAFLSDPGSPASGHSELYVQPVQGGRPVPLTSPEIYQQQTFRTRLDPPGYDCPVWSPDGKRLALVARSGQGSYLVIAQADGSQADRLPRYLAVDAPSSFTRPVWSPDGQRVVLVIPPGSTLNATPGRPARIIALQPDDPNVRQITLAETDGWFDVFGLAYSPNGREIVYQAVRALGQEALSAELRWMDADGTHSRTLLAIPEAHPYVAQGSFLYWLDPHTVVFASGGRLDARYKTHLSMLDTRTGALTNLASLEDMLYDLVLSPDRRWLAFSGDGGLYALDLYTALKNGSVSPALLSTQHVSDLDWR